MRGPSNTCTGQWGKLDIFVLNQNPWRVFCIRISKFKTVGDDAIRCCFKVCAMKFQDRQHGDKYSKVRQPQPRSWHYSYTGTRACNLWSCFITDHQNEIFKMLIIGVKVKKLEWIKAAICSVQLHLKPTLTYTGNIVSFILKNLFYLLIFFSHF